MGERGHIEPSLDELFGDDAIQLLMRRDGVTESEVRALLAKVREAKSVNSTTEKITTASTLPKGQGRGHEPWVFSGST